MSLYGALYSGVSGLKAQSNKIGVLSDNISNVNTVGYKGGSGSFESLVTSAAGSASYSPGGVLGGNQQLIAKQGLLQTTDSPTDIAISGDGFFVVNTQTDGQGSVFYTRAGSFTQDSTGNFINSAGFYLQAWPLDREGNLPGENGNLNTVSSANLSSLQTVNVRNLTGVAAATTTVSLGANLNSAATIYPGAAGNIVPDALSANKAVGAKDILVPGGVDNLTVGDRIVVATGAGSFTYRYGGFTYGRDVTTPGALGDGDQPLIASPTTLGASPFATTIGSTTVTVTQNTTGLKAGDVVTLSGNTDTPGGIPMNDLNKQFVISNVTSTGYDITVADPATSTATGGTGTIVSNTRPFNGNIFDATNVTTPFLDQTTATSSSNFTDAAKTLIINTAATGPVTFTYASSANPTNGTFNNLTTLAAAINGVSGLSARVVNGQIYVGATDATAAITFTNGDDVANVDGTGTIKAGLDWVGELGLANVGADANRFSSMQGLANLVNASPGLTATITNPLAGSSLKIDVNNPLDTIKFSDAAPVPAIVLGATPLQTTAGSGNVVVTVPSTQGYSVGDTIDMGTLTGGPYDGIPAADLSGQFTITAVTGTTVTIVAKAGATATAGSTGTGPTGISFTPPNNQGSVVAALGLVASLNNAPYTQQSTPLIPPSYDPNDPTKNMADGAIVPQFSRPLRIYDALGTPHDLTVGFIKTAANTWAVEVYSATTGEITAGQNPAGQIASGTLSFNGDGSLRSVSSNLTIPIGVSWTNGSVASAITFDWGTAGQPFGTPNASSIGKTDGMSQFSSDYKLNFANQNGAPVGELTGVSITDDGFVVASYNNGQTQNLFKIPLASFADPDALTSSSGNVFSQSSASGEVNLRQAGSSGVGTIAASSLEQSNVELADQLTDMIVAQRAYQANTKVISTTDTLLSELNDILR